MKARIATLISVWCVMMLMTYAAYANSSANISCGDPGQSGTVTVVVKVTKANGTTRQITWNAAILGTDTPEQKATKIRNAAPPADPDITVGGLGNVVSATTKNANDKITDMGFAKDDTNEKEATNVFAAVVTFGISSFKGIATGGGFVEVAYEGVTKRVNTIPAMTGAQIEDQLVALFNAAQVKCSISNVDPVPGVGTDGRYIYFSNPTFVSMTVEVTDPTISADLHMRREYTGIPTLTTWGLITLVVLLVAAGTLFIVRRRVSERVA